MAERSDSRIWRCNRDQAQPFIGYEEDIGVLVGPSRVHGLGVFAQRDFKEGERVCWYGGLCVKNSLGRGSGKYMLEGDYFNNATCTLEKWHLDAEDTRNACGRWINDSVGTKWEGVYNVRWCKRLSLAPHPIYDTYVVEIVALEGGIRKGEELFMDYGTEYWSRFRNYKGLDPDIPTGERYKQIMRYFNRR